MTASPDIGDRGENGEAEPDAERGLKEAVDALENVGEWAKVEEPPPPVTPGRKGCSIDDGDGTVRRSAGESRLPPNSSGPPPPPLPFPREAVVEYCVDLGCIVGLVRVGEGRSTSARADAEEMSPEVVGRDSALVEDNKNVEDPALSFASLQSSMTESLRD